VVCLRDGIEEQIQYDNIVVGDVIKIKAGMNIPVDGVVIKATGL
jgi:cation transport ATPase